MLDNEFEWDDAKALTKKAKHGVTFDMERVCFTNAFAVAEADSANSGEEDRYKLVGAVEDRMLTVSFAYRVPRVRIISARRATPHEQRPYYQTNTGKARH